jgi:hypothetical protein
MKHCDFLGASAIWANWYVTSLGLVKAANLWGVLEY